MRDRKREGTHTVVGKGATDEQTNKITFFCLVMGSGSQSDQWWSVGTLRPDKGG